MYTYVHLQKARQGYNQSLYRAWYCSSGLQRAIQGHIGLYTLQVPFKGLRGPTKFFKRIRRIFVLNLQSQSFLVRVKVWQFATANSDSSYQTVYATSWKSLGGPECGDDMMNIFFVNISFSRAYGWWQQMQVISGPDVRQGFHRFST